MQTVFITRYALSMGIKEVEVVRTSEAGFATVKWDSGWNNGTAVFSPRDYRLTKDEAIETAESMRKKKIDSLNKSIKKFESMTF